MLDLEEEKFDLGGGETLIRFSGSVPTCVSANGREPETDLP